MGLVACNKSSFVHSFVRSIVPRTAAIRSRRQSMKRQVEVKSMNHRPAADCTPCRRRRRHLEGRLLVDLMHFVQLHQRIFGKVFNMVVVIVLKSIK